MVSDAKLAAAAERAGGSVAACHLGVWERRWGASPLSKPLLSVCTPLMFRCATVVGLVFLLVMSKSDPAPLMPVRTYLDGYCTQNTRDGFGSKSAAFRPSPNAGGQNAFRERSETQSVTQICNLLDTCQTRS